MGPMLSKNLHRIFHPPSRRITSDPSRSSPAISTASLSKNLFDPRTKLSPSNSVVSDPFEALVDGKTLNGWDGVKSFWRIENGAIMVESTCEKPTGTIYLIWQGGEPADFELKLEMKGEGAAVNSGIQYRGAITDPNAARRPARP